VSKFDEPSLKEQAVNPAAPPRAKRAVHARPDKAALANGAPNAIASTTGFRFQNKRGPSAPGHPSRDSGSTAAKEASAKMRPSPPAGPTAAVGGASLKLPATAQMQIVNALLQDPEAPVAALAVELLQSNLRWPGRLRLDPQPVAQGAASDSQARLTYGDENFGSLTLEGGVRSPRTAEQLQAAAAWLGAILALVERHAKLRRQADTDELSGAFNRRYFMEKTPQLLEKARRERFCVTLLIFDIDNFKQYNDQFGHAAGDAIIREVIGLLRHCTRAKDMVARIGGDEFAVVFWDNQKPRSPDSEHPRSVLAIAQRFRRAVADHPWNTDGGPIAGRLSISGGLATFPWDAQDLHRLLEVADGELIRAKDMGKNAIVLAGPGVPIDDPTLQDPQSRPSAD
jgi:diguanylate cyclase (GGDEF)-like protein